MAIREIAKQTGRGLVAAAALFAVASLGMPQRANAIDTGTAVGIGLGAAALGAAVGANANPAPYAAPGYNPYYAAPAPGYYPAPAPGYYPPQRSCWDAYYQRYYAC